MQKNLNWMQRQVAKIATRSLKYAGIPLRDPALSELFGTAPTAAGLHVDEHNVTSLASYFSAVQLIASSVARVNFELLQLAKKTRSVEYVEGHRTESLFKLKPNKNYTPYQLIEVATFSAISWGNGYIKIDRDDLGFPISLWNLPAAQITPFFASDGSIKYKFHKRYKDEVDKIIDCEDMIHIPGFLFDGLKGYSVVSFARQSLGLSMAQEAFGASFFGNNSVPGGILTHPGSLDNKAMRRIQKNIEEQILGPLKSRKLIVLDEEMKFQAIGVPPEDSQFLESRQFQVKEICRWLRVPPHMLFEVDASTMGSIEEQGLDFITHSLGPWQDKWVQELRIKLLTPSEQLNYFFRPVDNSSILLSSDTAKRFENYSKGRNSVSMYTINDCRRLEGLPIIEPEIGDVLIAPSTMKNLGVADPTFAIPPATIDATIKLIKSFQKPIPPEVAKEICHVTMPSATEEFVNQLVATLKNNNQKEPEPEPTGSVA